MYMYMRQAIRLTFLCGTPIKQDYPVQLSFKHIFRRRLYSTFKSGPMSSESNSGSTMAEVATKNGLNRMIVSQTGLSEKVVRLGNIEKSEQDKREYRGLQLENGLKVLLISDSTTDMSAAALSVQVGYMSDPENLAGLAHFCEHMLFLGTEKYPKENEYSTYLAQNGGSSNAATFPLMTKYYFHVAPDKFEGALDRFAQFFVAPLFTESATDREINAVNSEHEKNLSSDNWRIQQVHHHLAKKDHPYSKFSTGNKRTLSEIPKEKSIDVRDELLKFHKKWYSSNIMCLAVIGKESLDELETMVIDKFSEVKNKSVKALKFSAQPFDESMYSKKVYIVPVKDIRLLTLSFTTDDLIGFYKSSPDGYLSHLIGHEGKGSILSELRKRGWCNELMAGQQNLHNGFGFFEIVVDLTEEGMNHVDDIAYLIFQYLQMLRKEKPQKWIFDECRGINSMLFRFKEKENPEHLVSHVATSMQHYPLEDVLKASYAANIWEPDMISDLLGKLVPSNCRVILVSQSYDSRTSQTEPIYGTKFGVEKIDAATLDKWLGAQPTPEVHLPAPNAFIPDNFDIAPLDEDPSNHPVIIMDTPMLRVWHKQDDVYLKPKACMSFEFVNPIAYLDPLNCSLNQMMVSLLQDQLNEYLYNAELAGLKMDLNAKTTGLEFSIRGYNDKQVVLLETLLDHVFNFTFDEKRFDILLDQHKRLLKNFDMEQPYYHSMYYLTTILSENTWTYKEQLETFERVTYERLRKYAKDFFQNLHMECFIYGNITRKASIAIADKVCDRLENSNEKISPLMAWQMVRKREYKLPNDNSYLYEAYNDYHKSACVTLYFQCGPQTDQSNSMTSLIAQIMSEPCYDRLRTKEQLGYIVTSGIRRANSTNGIRIIVQSSKNPNYVEQRIEGFLEEFLKHLEEMPDEVFERHRNALIVKKLEKPKGIYQHFAVFHHEISMEQYHFGRQEAEVAILREIKKDELVQCFKKWIAHNGGQRRLLSIHVLSRQQPSDSEDQEESNAKSKDHEKITDILEFKCTKELYPIVLPYIGSVSSKGVRSKL